MHNAENEEHEDELACGLVQQYNEFFYYANVW